MTTGQDDYESVVSFDGSRVDVPSIASLESDVLLIKSFHILLPGKVRRFEEGREIFVSTLEKRHRVASHWSI